MFTNPGTTPITILAVNSDHGLSLPGRKLGPWSEFPFLYRFTVLLNSGGSDSPWSGFWSEFPHFMGMGVVPAPSRCSLIWKEGSRDRQLMKKTTYFAIAYPLPPKKQVCAVMKLGHTPDTAGTFRKKLQRNARKTPETLSERSNFPVISLERTAGIPQIL